MPTVAKYKLPKLPTDENLGERLARLRKERGYTQIEIAERIGINRVLISHYETNKLRPHYEMIIHLSLALEVTSDELLGIKPSIKKDMEPSLKLLRRVKKIEALPASKQKILLQNIDIFLKGAEK